MMMELAKENRVLWLNSVGTRVPNLSSPRDLKKILNKLLAFWRPPERKSENLWVYTPVLLPLPHSRWATALNRWILRITLRRLQRRLGFGRFQLWSFLPNIVNYVGSLGELLDVYYC